MSVSIKEALQKETLSPFGHALAGALGGVFSNSIVYPLDTIKTRLQGLDDDHSSSSPLSPDEKRRRAKKGILVLLLKIYNEEGLMGFFKGFGANMLNTFSMQFAYFYFHTFLRSLTLRRLALRSPGSSPSRPTRAPQLSTATELLLGALAGCLAQIFTIPVAVIATRQQLFSRPTSASPDTPDPGFLETAREIIAESGVTGLWTGLKPGLVLTVNPAITYGVFERLKSVLVARDARAGGEGKLGAAAAFGLGMGSKTLATVVTYPYIFAKVRLQAKAASSSNNEPTSDLTPTASQTPSYAAVAATEPLAIHDSQKGLLATASDLETNASAAGASSEKVDVEAQTSIPASKKSKAKSLSAIEVLTQTYKKKGFAGWYQGMQAQILKAMLSQGILFMAKGQLERYALLLMILARRLVSAA